MAKTPECVFVEAEGEGEGGSRGGGAAGGAGGAVGGAGGAVGRLVDSSQAEDRRIIRLVRERPLLYARTNMPVASHYRSVRQLWADVAAEMGWTVAEVRRKWSHIRNSYSRHLRNEMYGVRTGKGRMVSRWYLADEMEFMREHMATDTRASPYAVKCGGGRTRISANFGADADASADGADGWASRVKLEPCEDSCSSSQGFAPEESSSYFQFFRGIHHDYAGLPERKQRQFRRQCLNMLHDLLDEEEAPASLYQNYAINLSNSVEGEDDKSVQIVETYNIFT